MNTINAMELYNSKDFISSVEYSLNLNEEDTFSSSDEITNYFFNLQYALFSTSKLKVYDDFLLIFDKYHKVIKIHTEPPSGYFNNAIFFQFRVNALLYQYFKSDKVTQETLKKSIQDLEFWSSHVKDKSELIDVNQKLIKLVQEVLDGKNIYYTIDFKLPFHIQLPDDEYQLEYEGKQISITTKIFKSDNLISYNKDRYFSNIQLKLNDFSNCDSYWKGSSIKSNDNESSEILTNILEIMNYFIFHIKLFDLNTKIQLLSPDDIGNITTTQYYSNSERYFRIVTMPFSGLTTVDILSPTHINGDITTFKSNIKENELLLYEELYSIALINYQKEDYLSAFYIINSAMEAMMEWYLKSYCQITDNIKFYDDMMKGKSACNSCDLYKNHQDELDNKPPISPNIPSLFTQLKFILRDITNKSNKDIKEITKLINDIKQSSIRNDLTHGRQRIVKREQITNSLNAFKKLESNLEDIYQTIVSKIYN